MKTKLLIKSLIITTMLTSCIATRKNISSSNMPSGQIEQIIYYASLAGSSHNTQPWMVDILSDTLLLIRADFSRKLNVVDPTARGLYISLGAFIENLCIASDYYGYFAKVYLTANSSKDNLVAEISLTKKERVDYKISKLEQRTTLRVPFKKDDISDENIIIITGGNALNYHFFSLDSDMGKFITQKTIEAYTLQANNQDAKDELANWIRFSNKDVKSKQDGLTTSGMGINGFGGFMVSRFFKPDDSKKQTFVDTGVKKTLLQAENCGGWLIITRPNNSPEDFINTGRLYQRANIECRDLMIGFHPMNQMIEEVAYESLVNETMGLNHQIQFVARIGYVDQYPDPVSVRRPISDFVKDFRVIGEKSSFKTN